VHLYYSGLEAYVTEHGKVLLLDLKEATLLRDVLDNWIETADRTKEAIVEDDATLPELETLLEVVSDFDDDMSTLRQLRSRLNE
jgi:hypothetical protein